MIFNARRTDDLELKIEQYQEHTNEYREDNDNQIELLRHEVSGLRCTVEMLCEERDNRGY